MQTDTHALKPIAILIPVIFICGVFMQMEMIIKEKAV